MVESVESAAEIKYIIGETMLALRADHISNYAVKGQTPMLQPLLVLICTSRLPLASSSGSAWLIVAPGERQSRLRA